MFLQVLAQGFTENSHAAAVDDTHARKAGEKCSVDEFFYRAGCLVHVAADHVQLCRRAGIFFERYGDAAGAGRRDGIYGATCCGSAGRKDFCNVMPGNLHLHVADFNFKGILVNLALDQGGAPERLQLHGISLRNVLDLMRTRVRIALVCAGFVRHHAGIKLFFEFTAQLGDALLRLFGKLLRGGAVLHGADGFAYLVLKVLDERFHLALKFADFLPLLLLAFIFQPLQLARKILLAPLGSLAFAFKVAQLRVQTVEKLAYVLRLRGQAFTRGVSNLAIEAETLRDVDAGRRSGHADAQLIGGLKSLLVKAHGRVERARGVGGIDLERGAMRGNNAERAAAVKMVCNGDGQRRAFFGIGGRAEFVKQDKRMGRGGARDEINVGDVRGEGGKILLDRLVIADIGKNGIKDRQPRRGGGHGNAGLRHERQQSNGFEAHGFAAGVGPADDELAMAAIHLKRERDYLAAFCFQIAFEQRMARGAQLSEGFSWFRTGELRVDAIVVDGEARLADLQLDFRHHICGGGDCFTVLAKALGHLLQNAPDFGLLFFQKADKIVVLLNGLKGLDEHGLSAGACAVNHAIDALALLSLDGDDEALSADGDKFVLDGAAFCQTPQIAAQRFLDGALLFFDVAPDAGELGGGAIVKRAVRLDLVAEVAQQQGEVCDLLGERQHADPVRLDGVRRMEGHLPPFGGFIDEQDEVANLLDLQRRAGNARFGQKIVCVEEAGEVEASTGGVKAARFVGKLLLVVDPCAIERGLQLRDAGLAQWRADVCAQNVTKVIEFQDAGGRMLERRRDHVSMMVSQDGYAIEQLHQAKRWERLFSS